MKWTKEADEAVAKIPFFVRGRVRKKVEHEATQSGAREVTIDHVRTCQQSYLNRMEDEVKGYQVESCFGPGGCPNRAVVDKGLVERLEKVLKKRKLKKFLKKKVDGPLKFHHEFRVTLADCPNACSRPQIADIGIIGARKPCIDEEIPCSECGACLEVCQEDAVTLHDGKPAAGYLDRCVSCGQCIAACPTGTLEEDMPRDIGILLGGKLGRHPRLAIRVAGDLQALMKLSILSISALITTRRIARLVSGLERCWRENPFSPSESKGPAVNSLRV